MKKDIENKAQEDKKNSQQRIPKSYSGFFYYLLKPSTLGVLALFCLLLYGLFLPPVIGMGDDGRTASIISGSGLYRLEELTPQESKDYLQKNWGIREYYNDSIDKQMTAQTLFFKAATSLDRAFTGDWRFDIRFYGAILALFYLLAMYLLFETVTYGKRSKWAYLSVALGVVIFGDTAYMAWINSFYMQALSFFLVIILGTSLILMEQKRFNDYLLITGYFLASLLLALLNQQYALWGVFLGILGISLRYVDKNSYYKRICLIGGSLLIMVSLMAFIVMPNQLTDLNKYHSMTRGVMMTADNPEKALAAFSINPEYAVLTGTAYYQGVSLETMNSGAMQASFFKQVTPAGVMVYYLAHPGQLLEMLNRSVVTSFTIRPPELGNYEKSAGFQPGAQADYFTLWSSFKAGYLSRNFGFIVIWMAVIIGVYVRDFRTGIMEKKERSTLRFVGLMTWLLIGLGELLVVIITSGDIDTLGHLFIFSLTFDLISCVIIAKLIHWFEKEFRKPDWQAKKAAFFKKNKNGKQGGYRL